MTTRIPPQKIKNNNTTLRWKKLRFRAAVYRGGRRGGRGSAGRLRVPSLQMEHGRESVGAAGVAVRTRERAGMMMAIHTPSGRAHNIENNIPLNTSHPDSIAIYPTESPDTCQKPHPEKTALSLMLPGSIEQEKQTQPPGNASCQAHTKPSKKCDSGI
jgi:hypothetical protein